MESQDIQIANCNLTGNVNAVRLQNVSNCAITLNIMQDNYYAAMYLNATIMRYNENKVIITNHSL